MILSHVIVPTFVRDLSHEFWHCVMIAAKRELITLDRYENVVQFLKGLKSGTNSPREKDHPFPLPSHFYATVGNRKKRENAARRRTRHFRQCTQLRYAIGIYRGQHRPCIYVVLDDAVHDTLSMTRTQP